LGGQLVVTFGRVDQEKAVDIVEKREGKGKGKRRKGKDQATWF
jgi:hypothetical protein